MNFLRRSSSLSNALSPRIRRPHKLGWDIALGLLLLLLSSCTGGTYTRSRRSAPNERYRLLGYYGSWDVYARHFPITKIDTGSINTLIYAFAFIRPDGTAALADSWADTQQPYPGDSMDLHALHGSFHQLQLLKKSHPGLQTLIAFGGWSLSNNLSDVAATSQSRALFARTAVDLFIRRWPGVFDGIDIDWEYPVKGGPLGEHHRPEDRTNYPLLLKAIRGELNHAGAGRHHYLLSVALPAEPLAWPNIDLEAITPEVDWVELMTYGFAHPDDPVTHFDASLRHDAPSSDAASVAAARSWGSVDNALNYYLQSGVPSRKILLGIPLYGRVYGGVPSGNDGLWQPHSATPPPGSFEPGILDDRDVETLASRGFQQHEDTVAEAPFWYNPESRLWVTADDLPSASRKAHLVRSRKLGGVMFWELSQDAEIPHDVARRLDAP